MPTASQVTASPPPEMPSRPVRRLAWLAGLLRLEDVLTSAVALVGLPLLDRLTSAPVSSTADLTATSSAPSALAGMFGLVAVAGVLACLCTRGPGEAPPLDGGTMTLQGWARFPLIAGIGIVAIETLPGLGIAPDPAVGLAFVVVTGTTLGARWLPVMPVSVRRLLVTPMALLATGTFNELLGGGVGGTIAGVLRGDAPPEIGAFLPLILGAILALYAMLVIAPRAIADPGASWLAWAVRFLLLLASLVLGDALFGIAA